MSLAYDLANRWTDKVNPLSLKCPGKILNFMKEATLTLPREITPVKKYFTFHQVSLKAFRSVAANTRKIFEKLLF